MPAGCRDSRYDRHDSRRSERDRDRSLRRDDDEKKRERDRDRDRERARDRERDRGRDRDRERASNKDRDRERNNNRERWVCVAHLWGEQWQVLLMKPSAPPVISAGWLMLQCQDDSLCSPALCCPAQLSTKPAAEPFNLRGSSLCRRDDRVRDDQGRVERDRRRPDTSPRHRDRSVRSDRDRGKPSTRPAETVKAGSHRRSPSPAPR